MTFKSYTLFIATSHSNLRVPCFKCGKESLQPIAELVANDDSTCSYCGIVIDLRSDGRKAELLKFKEEYIKVQKST